MGVRILVENFKQKSKTWEFHFFLSVAPVWLVGLVSHSLSRTSCDGQNLPIYLRMEGAAKWRSAQGLCADDNNKAKGTITGKGRQK